MNGIPGLVLPAAAAGFVARQREQAERLRAAHGVAAQSWYRITNASDSDEAEVMLYDEIGGWFGATADEFIADLRGVTAPKLRVRINSPGGSVFEGIAIANALRSHPANVTVQVDSVAASIASVIAMSGDRIEMAPNAMLMIHDASGVCLGDAADMEEMAELLGLISDNIADAYAARAGGTRAQWREAMQQETWYLPEDAVAAGLADEALAKPKAGEPAEEAEPDEDEPDMARAWDLAAYGYTGPRQPDPPKPRPAPPRATAVEDASQMVVSLAELLGEDTVARLQAAVAAPADSTPTAGAAPVDDGDDAAEPAEAAPEPAPAEPTDSWADLVAHLTDDAPDWSALVSNLIEPEASSSAATD
ncbi:head maturation protease, ClpP-related [Streptomyces silaceus]|uniref:head maturation protease, ClpP-related n=1 Tax=Streptomyces silaceus TaxID=545123 RepID=UPI0006EB69CD|nr:head maturation protease, ClpP-related [Streptomyces silaceus]